MESTKSLFMWSDNWWIEKDRAWFVGGKENILFCLNLRMNEIESAVCIPEESASKLRLTPFCMKCGEDIFCFPDMGKYIWIYNVCSKIFSKITVDNPNNVRMGIYDFWKYDNKLFAVSGGLGKIIKIDIAKKEIESSYTLCDEKGIRKSIKVGNRVYSLSSVSDKVFQFDLNTNEVIVYRLPDIGRKFSTFCFDGENFWLSGYYKEIYVWNKKAQVITIMDTFPKEFGIYNFSKNTNGEIDYITNEYELPAFLYSVAVGDYVWFIPFQTNKIVYVNKRDYRIHTFEVVEENETKESLLGRNDLSSKYILEYVREDRYIGLFSIKNNYILEIDVLEIKAKIKYYALNEKCVSEVIDMYNGYIFYEKDKAHKQIFEYKLLNQGEKQMDKSIGKVGFEIYKTMN